MCLAVANLAAAWCVKSANDVCGIPRQGNKRTLILGLYVGVIGIRCGTDVAPDAHLGKWNRKLDEGSQGFESRLRSVAHGPDV
jgi:hypothetical protein